MWTNRKIICSDLFQKLSFSNIVETLARKYESNNYISLSAGLITPARICMYVVDKYML